MMGVPRRFRQAVKALYHKIWIQVSFGGAIGAGFWAERGIKQGCPLSGSIFALAFDPILRLLESRLPRGLAAPGAFADDVDIGGAVVSILASRWV